MHKLSDDFNALKSFQILKRRLYYATFENTNLKIYKSQIYYEKNQRYKDLVTNKVNFEIC